jgi:hypothetical protein
MSSFMRGGPRDHGPLRSWPAVKGLVKKPTRPQPEGRDREGELSQYTRTAADVKP